MNLALSRNVESREPVRVIRGYKLQSPFAPEYGYRYDGSNYNKILFYLLWNLFWRELILVNLENLVKIH